MQYSVTSGDPDKNRTACVAVPVYKGNKLSPSAMQLDRASGGAFYQVMRKHQCGDLGSVSLFTDLPNICCSTVLAVGVGTEKDITPEVYDRICKALLTKLIEYNFEKVLSYIHNIKIKKTDLYWRVKHCVMSIEEGMHEPLMFKVKRKDKVSLKRWVFGIPKRTYKLGTEKAIIEGEAVGTAINITNELECVPRDNTRHILEKLREYQDNISVRDVDDINFLQSGITSIEIFRSGVGVASAYYKGAAQSDRPLAIVSANTAAALSCLLVAHKLHLPINILVVFISIDVALLDNEPDIMYLRAGLSSRVMSARDKRIGILSDIVGYVNCYRPSTLITIAGKGFAGAMCLGNKHPVVFHSDISLQVILKDAISETKDFYWMLPLIKNQYQLKLDSIADFKFDIESADSDMLYEIGVLSSFVGNKKWVHINSSGMYEEGVPRNSFKKVIRLLAQYLLNITY